MPCITASQPAAQAIFQCSVCNRAFKRPDHLARHERAHSNSRPFCCGLCGRRFGRRDILLRHSNHVHREEPLHEYLQFEDEQQIPSQPPTRRGSISESPSSDSGGDAAPTPATALVPDVDTVGSKVASLGESGLDDFLDSLLGLSSYANVAQIIQHGMPNQLHISSPTGAPVGNHLAVDPTRLPTRARRESVQRVPRPTSSESGRTYMVPSFHHNLFPQESLMRPAPPALSASRIFPPLTRSTFDLLVKSYKTHCAGTLPFLHFPTLDLSFDALSDEGAQGTCAQGGPCNRWKRRAHPTLVLSILSLGASCVQEKTLALELYSRTRKELLSWLPKLQRMESNEAPPLHFYQAFINYICFGLTCGDEVMEQLTVGHTASLRSLVSLASLEQPAFNTPTQPQTTCRYCEVKGPTDWLNWANHEERKRTFFAYFSLMSACLTYLDSVASVDWREVRHSMPCSDQAWLADSPQAWRFASKSEVPQPLFSKEVQALFHDSQGSDAQNDAATESTLAWGSDRDTQAKTLESPNALSCHLLISALHREICHGRLQGTVDVAAMRVALQQWQTLWLRLAQQEGTPAFNPLVSCSLAMFDNTQLLLHVDVKEAKEALVSRQFGKFCMVFPDLDLRLDSEGSGCSLSSGRDNWHQTYEIYYDIDKRTKFRHIANYSVSALEMTFKGNPVWCSGQPRVQLSLHTGMAIFYCTQILTTWLCFVANCLNRRLYTDWLAGSDNSEELEDEYLLRKILAFAQNRRTQFKENFGIPSSPDDLKEQDMGRLAYNLLDLHSRILGRCATWPAFKNLSEALRIRSAIISDWLEGDGAARSSL